MGLVDQQKWREILKGVKSERHERLSGQLKKEVIKIYQETADRQANFQLVELAKRSNVSVIRLLTYYRRLSSAKSVVKSSTLPLGAEMEVDHFRFNPAQCATLESYCLPGKRTSFSDEIIKTIADALNQQGEYRADMEIKIYDWLRNRNRKIRKQPSSDVQSAAASALLSLKTPVLPHPRETGDEVLES